MLFSHRTDLPNNAVDIGQEDEPSDVIALSGSLIDTRGAIWRLSADHVVDFTVFGMLHSDASEAVKGYARHLIRNNAPIYVTSQISRLIHITNPSVASTINKACENGDFIPRAAYEGFRKAALATVSLPQMGGYAGTYVRWYIWATDADYEAFSPEVAAEFEQLQTGSNPQGQAVLRSDPSAGPLHEVEMIALRSGLKAAGIAGTLDLQDLCLAWLYLSFGTNSKNLRMLNEEDLIITIALDGGCIYELRIPRIKKRTRGPRDQFRTRRLVGDVGRLLERLIEENKKRPGYYETKERPMFRRSNARVELMGTPFVRDLYRCTTSWPSSRLRATAAALGLRSKTGEDLKLHPRRLRYSFATRLVQEGASPQEVADALDHSSVAHVMVYFNARSDAVRPLDRALTMLLAPVAQAFLGKVIDDESRAARGGDARSRIRHNSPTMRSLETVGNCGSFAFCGLMAPIACYTCPSFQPWLYAAHEHVLGALETRRKKKLEQGADPKWTQLYDETILAVALVIIRCDELKAERAPT